MTLEGTKSEDFTRSQISNNDFKKGIEDATRARKMLLASFSRDLWSHVIALNFFPRNLNIPVLFYPAALFNFLEALFFLKTIIFYSFRMTSRPDKRTMEHAKASGIVRDNVAGTSFIPATQVKLSECESNTNIYDVILACRWYLEKSKNRKGWICPTWRYWKVRLFGWKSSSRTSSICTWK